MKKVLLFAVSALLCIEATAALRTAQEAMQIAASLGTDNRVARVPSRQPQNLTLCHTARQENGQPAFYVFNRGEDEGFVLISAEDRTHTVLGYADEGHWDETDIAPATRDWLEAYNHTISLVAAAPDHAYANGGLQAPAKKNAAYTAVSPICQTQWGQRSPYNQKCPTYHDTVCPAGCVAIAAAQIMKVYNHPTRGTGSSSYLWQSDTGDSITLSANYNTTYNWSQMLNSYTSSSTTTQKNAVATLVYHCGVVCEMAYGPRGSGAKNQNVLRGMVEHFGYDAGVQALVRDCMREDDFVAAIADELQQGRPVMFSARTVNNEGHAYVCDGIDADGLIHLNWGWYGSCDGYFRVSAMDPDNQGTGGSATNSAFTQEIVVHTHIRPDVGGSYQYTITGDTVFPYQESFNRYQEPVALQVEKMANQSIQTLYGSSAMKVYDANGNFLSYYDGDWNYNGLPPNYYYYTTYVVADVSSLPEGNYFVSPMVKVDGRYVPVQVKGYSDYRCAMQVTQNYIYLTQPEPESELPDPTSYTYTDIRGYYYPTGIWGCHNWRIQLSTADFYANNADDNQMLLLFNVGTASPRSFAGTFLSDTTLLYHCVQGTVYHGNINNYEAVTAEDCEVTVEYHSNTDSYTLYYRIRLSGRDYIGQANISASSTFGLYGSDYQTHQRYEQITLDNTHYTGISTTVAMDKINAHQVGWVSDIPYIIEGWIESLANTPEQIIQYGNCRLNIHDGTTSLYAYNTKWLNNQAYPTGNEIAVGGLAAVIGYLKYYNASTKEIDRGYFYHYNASGTKEAYGLQTDAESADFIEDFNSYTLSCYPWTETDYFYEVKASQNNAYIKFYLFPAAGSSDLTSGTYTFDFSGTPFTAWPGNGIGADGYISGSYAGYSNGSSMTIPLWFPVNGTVTVSDDGVLSVRATNSYGRMIRCRLTGPVYMNVTPAREESTGAQKMLRNGHVYILRNGVTYTVRGEKISGLE